MLAVGDDVVRVKIGAAKQRRQREVRAYAREEAVDFRVRAAGRDRHELHPAEGTLIQCADHLELGIEPAIVQPRDEVVIASLHGHRPRLVDETRPTLEAEDMRRLSAVVDVARYFHRGQSTGMLVGEENRNQLRLGDCNPREQAPACLLPAARDADASAHEHGILREQARGKSRVLEAVAEKRKARFRRVSLE